MITEDQFFTLMDRLESLRSAGTLDAKTFASLDARAREYPDYPVFSEPFAQLAEERGYPYAEESV